MRREEAGEIQVYLLVCITLAFNLSNVAVALHELLQSGLLRLKIVCDALDDRFLLLALGLERIVPLLQVFLLFDELIDLRVLFLCPFGGISVELDPSLVRLVFALLVLSF